MSTLIQLHGGPLHGVEMAVNVTGPRLSIYDALSDKICSYSRVLGYPQDYEWDGWGRK